MKFRRKLTVCPLAIAMILVQAISAPAALTWTVTTPAVNATVNQRAVPFDLTLGWSGPDFRPTQIRLSLVVNGVQYPSASVNGIMDNTVNPVTYDGTFDSTLHQLGAVAGKVRFENIFNAMVNSTKDVNVTVN